MNMTSSGLQCEVIIIIIIIFNMTSDKTQMKLQSVEWKLVSTCLYTKVV